LTARDYQIKMVDEILWAWASGVKNVLAVAPTGAGKTYMKAMLFQQQTTPAIAIAHRQELVSQVSLALARKGIRHRVIAPNPVVANCVAKHVKECGVSHVDAASPIMVSSVQTLLARQDKLGRIVRQCQMWDIDEAHHVLADNQWGKAVGMLAHAKGVGFTATPYRADKKALGRKAKGVFDTMVIGPTTRELIDQKHLSDYRIYGPAPSIDTSKVETSKATGDYKQNQLRTAAHQSRIVGDITQSYLRFAAGLIGITFMVDVELAYEQAAAFNHHGVPAVAVDAKTDADVRDGALERLARGDLKQVVNVDLFGEGMDCPAIEVVSMGRPTMSRGLYRQQFGRALRMSPGKQYGICIDHAENVRLHGPPDAPEIYDLDGEVRKTRDTVNGVAIKTCPSCILVYEAFHKKCPFCGHEPPVPERSRPEHVDGDLFEYTPEMLAEMRGEIDRIAGPPQIPTHLEGPAATGAAKQWGVRQRAQHELRRCIDEWAGCMKHGHHMDDNQIFRKFYHTFGLAISDAMVLGTKDANKLTNTIRGTLT